ncbi:MAG: TadE/TadG family type IV pilus assembly protein [Bacillota bacterium]
MFGLIKDKRGSITLEFALCGIMFIGFVLGMVVMGLWMYNVSQAKQASRIAAHTMAITGNPVHSHDESMKYLDKTLIACTNKQVGVYGDNVTGYGVVQVEMDPLFPGFQRLIDPKGSSTINGRIQIRREAAASREFWLRLSESQINK